MSSVTEKERWLNDLALNLMYAYRTAMQSYACTSGVDSVALAFNEPEAVRGLMERMTYRGANALGKVFGPSPHHPDRGAA